MLSVVQEKHFMPSDVWNRMLLFTFPLQLKGTCLPQKKMFCPRFSILYGWDCIGIYKYMFDEAQSYLAGSLPPC